MVIYDENKLLIKWLDSYEIIYDVEWFKKYFYNGGIKLLNYKEELFLWDKKVIELKMFCGFDFIKVFFNDDEFFIFF